MRTAVYHHDPHSPSFELTFDYSASLTKRVKALPSRRWDPDARVWIVTGTGAKNHPLDVLEDLGFEIDLGKASENDATDVWEPLAVHAGSIYWVYPRLTGFDATLALIGIGAAWDKQAGAFRATADQLVDADGELVDGLRLDDSVDLEAVRAEAEAAFVDFEDPRLHDDLQFLAHAGGTEDELDDHLDAVADEIGAIPGWFGLDLSAGQEAGVYAAAAGRSAIVDEPGAGKTRMSLAAAALHHPKRLVCVVPPLVLTNWARETRESFVPGWSMLAPDQLWPVDGRGKPHADAFSPYVTVLRAGKKWPELPDVGAAIVPFSLLKAKDRRAIELLKAWSPDAAIFDEVHRVSNAATAESRSALELARTISPGCRFALTGTPLTKNPAQLVPMLELTGHLGPVFGGASAFLDRYAYKDKFGGWRPKKKRLPELGATLDEEVWVRRTKKQLMPELDGKFRTAELVDVSLKRFKEAHASLTDVVKDWFDENKHRGHVTEAQIRDFVGQNLKLFTPLRVAAGLAKIDAAVEWITDWLNQTVVTKDGVVSSDRPLVVWIHHTEVMDALRAALAKVDGAIDFIAGSTSSTARQEKADAFQAGKIQVLICSIKAAGFGITLTRSADALFVEQTWNPSDVTQAEDRIHRKTQTRQVAVTTLLAVGTLDEVIQQNLGQKSKVISEVMPGADIDVTAVTAERDSKAGAVTALDDAELPDEIVVADVLTGIVIDLLPKGAVAD